MEGYGLLREIMEGKISIRGVFGRLIMDC